MFNRSPHKNDSRKNNGFFNSGAAALTLSQLLYHGRIYHELPLTDEDKLNEYFYQYGKQHFTWKERLLSDAFEIYSQKTMDRFFSFVGNKDYTGYTAATYEFAINQIDHTIKHGATQVILPKGLFLGYATIAHKKYPNVHFFEITTGDVHQLKIDALKSLEEGHYPSETIKEAAAGLQQYGTTNANLHLINADLQGNTWDNDLIASGFDPEKNTICAASAMSVYLSPDDNKNFMKKMHSLLSPESTLILDFVPPRNNKLNAKAGYQISKSMVGSEYKTMLAPESAPGELFNNGFYVTKRLPYQSIYTSIGLTEEQIKSVNLKQNFFIARPKHESDELRELDDIPVINEIDWKRLGDDAQSTPKLK